jgi:hypothetical protein
MNTANDLNAIARRFEDRHLAQLDEAQRYRLAQAAREQHAGNGASLIVRRALAAWLIKLARGLKQTRRAYA